MIQNATKTPKNFIVNKEFYIYFQEKWPKYSYFNKFRKDLGLEVDLPYIYEITREGLEIMS